jgi:hypothetical protein
MSTSVPSAEPAPSEGRAVGHADRAGRVVVWLWLSGLLGLTLIFPLYQLIKSGVLYYENGPDEFSYLQYDFSRATESLTRPGQFLVSQLHHLGLSGGWINVVLDTAVLLGFPLLVAVLLRRIGWSRLQAGLGSLLMVVLPHVVLESNPLVQRLSDWNVRSGMVYWLNLPDVHFSPLLRSPEPQLSLMLLVGAVLVAVRLRAFLPVYIVLPVMYPFVAIPAAFVALACQLRARWPFGRFDTAGPLLASFLAVSGVCLAYYTFLVGERTRLIVVTSYWPLFSFTGAIALGLYLTLRHGIAPAHRFLALAIALAPWVASNQQLISGHVPQPDSFEQYVGCLAVAAVATLALKDRPWLRGACLALGTVFFLLGTYHTFRVNQAYMIRLPMTAEILSALKTDPRHVVVNDPFLASLWGMVHPRQPSTALAFEHSFVAMSDRYAPEYRCIKQQVQAERPGTFDHAFGLLDEAYAYGSQKYIMAHITRKSTFVKLHDVEAACADDAKRPLRYFYLLWNPYEPEKSRVTPSSKSQELP